MSVSLFHRSSDALPRKENRDNALSAQAIVCLKLVVELSTKVPSKAMRKAVADIMPGANARSVTFNVIQLRELAACGGVEESRHNRRESQQRVAERVV